MSGTSCYTLISYFKYKMLVCKNKSFQAPDIGI